MKTGLSSRPFIKFIYERGDVKTSQGKSKYLRFYRAISNLLWSRGTCKWCKKGACQVVLVLTLSTPCANLHQQLSWQQQGGQTKQNHNVRNLICLYNLSIRAKWFADTTCC